MDSLLQSFQFSPASQGLDEDEEEVSDLNYSLLVSLGRISSADATKSDFLTSQEEKEREELVYLAGQLHHMNLERLGRRNLERFFELAERYADDGEDDCELTNCDWLLNPSLLPAIHQKVVVFSLRGNKHCLDRGTTVLDFAYHLHTELGQSCIGAVLNERIEVGPEERLRDGTRVRIKTGETEPQHHWLDMVTTTKAQRSIKRYLRRQEYWRDEMSRSPTTLPNRCPQRLARRPRSENMYSDQKSPGAIEDRRKRPQQVA